MATVGSSDNKLSSTFSETTIDLQLFYQIDSQNVCWTNCLFLALLILKGEGFDSVVPALCSDCIVAENAFVAVEDEDTQRRDFRF